MEIVILIVLIAIPFILYQILTVLQSQHKEVTTLLEKQIAAIEQSSISALAASILSTEHADPERLKMRKQAEYELLGLALNSACPKEDRLSDKEVEKQIKMAERRISELSVYSEKNRRSHLESAESIFDDIKEKYDRNA